MLCYSSTRNTRIERLWVEVGNQFLRRWKAFFTRLSRLHGLNSESPTHRWLLHTLFLQTINDDIDEFVRDWNSHPISGIPGNQTPSVYITELVIGVDTDVVFPPQGMRFLSLMDNSEVDNYEDVDPRLLNQFYGTHGHVRRHTGQTGAGHSDSEDEQSSDADEECAADNHNSSDESSRSSSGDESQGANLREQLNSKLKHEAVEVPPSVSPFTDDQLNTFLLMLNEIFEEEIIPDGYGVREEEWGEDGYEEEETIKVGFRATKLLTMGLPQEIWHHRVVKWAQALDLMLHLQIDWDLD